MPHRPVKALLFALLVWLIGFVWGSVVFMTPALRDMTAIPYVSTNPFISFPILITWLVTSYLLAKSYLKNAFNKKVRRTEAGDSLFSGKHSARRDR